jgi:hypothetical protein
MEVWVICFLTEPNRIIRKTENKNLITNLIFKIMVFGILLNLLFSLWIIPMYLGENRKIGYMWSMVACLFLTPLIGVIITLSSPKLD